MYLKRRIVLILAVILIFGGVIISLSGNQVPVFAQQPTGSIPTVTGTPKGLVATIKIGLTEDYVNVRSGPSSLYPAIGVILLGAEVPVLGRSVGGDWLVVEYPGVQNGIGWVWANYMNVTPGELPVIENPPSPVPLTTVTLDPTMAAQFMTTPEATRLPTFTQPAALVIPTYSNSTGRLIGGIPIGLVIIVLAGLGILIGVFAVMQSR
jgi:hypothetical protein